MNTDPSLWTPHPPDTSEPPVGAVKKAVMVQHWTDIVFCHWRYDPAVVQQLLPAGVEVDTFDGSAWVGLIPFHMDGLGFPGLAPLPYVGSFPEVNVRTYVRAGNRRGVWFMSLDIDRWLPALVARLGYRIPYCVGDVRHVRIGDRVMSSVQRKWPSTRYRSAEMS
ncbi:MAG: YqjF family protein, partial [Ilumatobacteraceae bacterium]